MARRAPNARPADRGPVSGGGRRGFRLNAGGASTMSSAPSIPSSIGSFGAGGP